MSSKFLAENKSAAVSFAMVHTYAGRLFNKAAAAKDADVIKIISDATKVPAPLIERAAPRCFFFQAEDGIRDGRVTGVQTCALPISPLRATQGELTFQSARHDDIFCYEIIR